MNAQKRHGFLLLLLLPLAAWTQIPQLLQDDFSESSPYWLRRNLAPDSFRFSDQGLQWRQQAPTDTTWLLQEQLIRQSDEFWMLARTLPGGTGLSYEWGLIWSANEAGDQYYSWRIRPDGTFGVFRFADGKETAILPWDRNRRLKGSGEPHDLRLVRDGWRITLLVNDKEMAEFSAPKITGKYHGLIFVGAGEVQVTEWALWRESVDLNLLGGRFEGARRRPLDSTINHPWRHETAPRLGPDKHGLYLSVDTAAQPWHTQGRLGYARVRGDSIWGQVQLLDGPAGRLEPVRIRSASLDLWQSQPGQPPRYWQASGQEGVWGQYAAIPIMGLERLRGVSSMYLSDDGETMLVSADGPDNYGEQDLYLLTRQPDGTWREPRNLGPDLNTFESEFAPWLDRDGRTLYFASGGHPGYGGYDIYRTKRLSQTWTSWSEPQNLGPRVNTRFHEGWYYPFARNHAYLAATDSIGGDFDLYGLRIPIDTRELPVVRLQGKIRNKKNQELLAGEVWLRPLLGRDSLEKVLTAPVAEQGFRGLVAFGAAYEMIPLVPGYFPVIDTLDLRALDSYRDIERDLWVVPLQPGEVFRLDRVYFVRAQAELLPASYDELDRLVALLKAQPALQIEIRGHTDNIGQPEELQWLSEQRAQRVQAYLVQHGIAAQRLTAKGFGATMPVADNRNPETRPLNRRVEFTIIQR